MGLILSRVSARDLILDGQSVSLYVGGSPPVKVWPTKEVVQITLGTGFQARDQFLAALSARGLDYKTVTEIPFDIELVGTGSAQNMFMTCSALTKAPAMDTSQVTSMSNMFRSCSSMTSVPDLDTNNVTDVDYMFYNCSSLTDGNVRLIGRHPQVTTTSMTTNSGLTREPWYNADGTPLAPRKVTIEKNPSYAGFKQPATGDVSLIDRWLGTSGEIGAFFVAPVTCNRDLRNANTYSTIRAGTTIPAGQGVYPTYSQGTPYVFTEVL